MIPYVDLHTHGIIEKENVIGVYNLMLNEPSNIPSHPFSAGLHPWHADQLSIGELTLRLKECLLNPDLVAIGETGLDKACKVPMELQMDVFECQLRIASENKKPVIIHCVKAWEEVIKISSKYKSIKILHGFNESIQLTKRLINKGFYFSIGKAILNPETRINSSIHLIPGTSLFCETDASKIEIERIYQALCEILQLRDQDLRKIIFDNLVRLKGSA